MHSSSFPVFLRHSVFVGLAAAAAAQQLPTLPSGFQNTFGSTQQVLGFYPSIPERIQVIYSPAVLPSGTFLLTGLQLRNRGQPGHPMTNDITVRVSSLGVPMPEQASQGSFAANHGVDLQTTVLVDVPFPAVTLNVPAVVDLPLAAPFACSGSLPLLIELEIDSTYWFGAFADWAIEMHEFPSEFWDPIESVPGTGCTPTGITVTKVARVFPPEERVVWRHFGNHPAGTPSVLLLGLSDQHFGGIPLPFDLAIAGAPGCPLEVSIDCTEAVFATPVGFSPLQPVMFTSDTLLPRTPSLAGTSVSGQYLILAPGANAGGFVMTPHARYDLVQPPAAERMRYSHSALAPGLNPDVIQTWLPDRGFVLNFQ